MNTDKSTKSILIGLGLLIIFIPALSIGSLYLGWHMGRQQIDIPAPVINVPAAEVNVEAAVPDVHVSTEKPEVNVTVEPAKVDLPEPRLNINQQHPLVAALEELAEAQKRQIDSLHDLSDFLVAMRTEISQTRKDLAKIPRVPEVIVPPDLMKHPDGKLLPAPKE